MPKEFTYRQRKTTDSYRKGWEKVFSERKKVYDDKLSIVSKELSETTEQKQPSLDNQSKKHQ